MTTDLYPVSRPFDMRLLATKDNFEEYVDYYLDKMNWATSFTSEEEVTKNNMTPQEELEYCKKSLDVLNKLRDVIFSNNFNVYLTFSEKTYYIIKYESFPV